MSRLAVSVAAMSRLVYPHICPACMARAPRAASDVCEPCHQALDDVAPPYCPGCGTMNDTALDFCNECLVAKRRWRQAFSVFRFSGLARELIHRFKYNGHTALAGFLAQRAYAAWAERRSGPMPSAVAAVPLHWFKSFRRGYNQSQLVAEAVGAMAGLPLARPLERRQWTQPQAQLSRAERQLNIRGAFRRRKAFNPTGDGVLLIDDVFTTGATLDACTRILLKAGVGFVDVLTIARG